MLRNIVVHNRYVDSVMLMALAAKAREATGAEEVSAMMGTDANKALLEQVSLLDDGGRGAGAMDIIIAVRADDADAVRKAASAVEELLGRRPAEAAEAEAAPRSLEGALARLPDARLLFISLPGAYARREAEAALDRGLHVLIFSDNVPLEDEIALKEKGRRLGLIVMGPDCGTAVIGGVALGFANVLRRGPVGIIGASGTGIQEVSCLLSNAGAGVSQAIGLGGRDLREEVGGTGMLMAIDALEADAATGRIVLISKPPAPAVAARVLDRAKACRTPVIVNFLNGDPAEAERRGLPFSPTLEGAAVAALASLRGVAAVPAALAEAARAARGARADGQRFIRGLFSGGTLCDEALLVLRESVGDCRSNIPLTPDMKLEDARRSEGNCLLDLGDDEFTRGRPHPMIDFTLRRERIVEEARDPATAVILLDVVLGYGAHPDPARELVPAIEEARRAAGRPIATVASVTGTDGDPQGRARQKAALEAAGVIVAGSNAQAARIAGGIVA
ncbi:MAG: acyl-CoA synthetase FdrA [bacterium]|nr:acyl-CoA synthetase FdrA [bacterium]